MSSSLWSPQQYEKFKNERSRPFLDLMNLAAPVPGKNVIDLGCGTGELTRSLHEYLRAESTTGLDSSPEMLAKAEKFAGPGLSFAKGDIQRWEPKEKYAVIFSNAALQWCTHHEQLFSKFFAALESGGQLLVQMPMNHDYPTHVIAQTMSHEPELNGKLRGAAYDRFDSMLRVEDYARLLFKLGFSEQNVTVKVYGHVLSSREEVIEWVKGSMLTFFEGRLSPGDYAVFLTDFRARLFEQLADDKPFFFPFKRILLWAKK